MPAIAYAKIGDTIPGTDTCNVILMDSDDREVRMIVAPEDDLIPFMRQHGYFLGVYLGNSTYRML